MIRIGIGGPVGSGKTALIEHLCRKMYPHYSIAAITNDIYTKEDARILTETGVLPPERIMGVQTGGCPHTAIREDVSMNLEAVHEMTHRIPGLDILFIESGGDNLSSTFSPDLVECFIFVIDVAEGEKIPRKGGPAICGSDLLVINKTDLAPYVNARVEVMERDAKKMRGGKPFIMTSLVRGEGLDDVISWIKSHALLSPLTLPVGMGVVFSCLTWRSSGIMSGVCRE